MHAAPEVRPIAEPEVAVLDAAYPERESRHQLRFRRQLAGEGTYFVAWSGEAPAGWVFLIFPEARLRAGAGRGAAVRSAGGRSIPTCPAGAGSRRGNPPTCVRISPPSREADRTSGAQWCSWAIRSYSAAAFSALSGSNHSGFGYPLSRSAVASASASKALRRCSTVGPNIVQ
jgi:hypothetical protein